jgi:hypothetical protein
MFKRPAMIHPDSELRFVSPLIGYGLFATKIIPKGTITWVFDPLDQVITDGEYKNISFFVRKALDTYSYLNGNGDRILCWDHARYVNHACNPACLAAGFDFEIAVRDILPGEEITDDYGTLNLEREMICHCGAAECRKVLRPDDFTTYGEKWDREVANVFFLLPEVEQPLWGLVQEKDMVTHVLERTLPLPSCLVHRCGGGQVRSVVGIGS